MLQIEELRKKKEVKRDKREFVEPSWRRLRSRSSIRYLEHLAPLTIRPDPIFPLSFPHPGNAFYPQTWRTKRSCGPGFPRSTPSAGTPRELSAKRQYALRRHLSIHPDLTPSPPGRPREIQPSVERPLDNLQSHHSVSLSLLFLFFPFRLT